MSSSHGYCSRIFQFCCMPLFHRVRLFLSSRLGPETLFSCRQRIIPILLQLRSCQAFVVEHVTLIVNIRRESCWLAKVVTQAWMQSLGNPTRNSPRQQSPPRSLYEAF